MLLKEREDLPSLIEEFIMNGKYPVFYYLSEEQDGIPSYIFLIKSRRIYRL